LLADFLLNPSVSGTTGAIDRFKAYSILRPTGGAAVLDFNDHEIRTFERRLAEAQAA
jgi:hypothetical protein